MRDWHSPQCRRPDVVIYEGLGLPTCMDCGEMCPPHEVDKDHQDELKIPPGPRRTAMHLTWPPTMSFTKKAYPHGPVSLNSALNIYLENLPCHKEDGQETSFFLSETSSRNEPSLKHKPMYKELHGNRIRVLRLSKGRFESPVHGFLEVLDLESQEPNIEEPGTLLVDENRNHTEYEAVSYTWATSSGNRRKDHVIFIGKAWNMLPITENCFDALKNCRLEDRDRYLWIDSICINQSDISERTHQVGMMREIYSAASRVLIYLSVDRANSSRAVDDPEVLCLNPYFSRIWVVQEIGSAKKALVLYDRQSMSWGFFHENLQRLMTKRWIRHFGRPRQIDDMSSFLALLEDTWDCHATDPRDKVFALLGLWEAYLEPDYTLPPQAVYTGLAASFVTDENKKLAGRVLDMASQGHFMPGLPSWVPDWSVKSQQLYQRTWSKGYKGDCLTEFFNLVYQEQFELLWFYVLYDAESTKQAVEEFPLLNIGAQFARLFWWRFYRSIHRVYHLLEGILPTDDQIEQQWNACLKWLSQRNSMNHVADLPSYEPKFRHKPEDDADFPSNHRVYHFFSKLNYYGWFISIPLPGVAPEDIEKTEPEPTSRSKLNFAERRLSQIVHSEIQRRRLPEKLFSSLFSGTHTNQELPDLDYEKFQAMVDNGHPHLPDYNLAEGWRQEAKSWNEVEAYVSDSEWHMTSLKLKLLGGWGARTEEKKNWDIYKEIVVI
ncbi:uncharacterized protein FIESC28_10217 [Fusarium coffeatum]|uniref:Heterokaryon incompatibility domain-containing protein n=1 Tax=Fusarium coffeatum TaxID=231269 RepID=A0A366QUH9_9HYPO|nr:uncharacterized protein FIESC28_10217 [Fusarium coffeatum]RBR08527.1 hypothetical protein FIESC28_10217 [Fusarium coffeatum]